MNTKLITIPNKFDYTYRKGSWIRQFNGGGIYLHDIYVYDDRGGGVVELVLSGAIYRSIPVAMSRFEKFNGWNNEI